LEVALEVERQTPGMIEAIQQLSGVESVREGRRGQSTVHLSIQCRTDLRAEIARAVVESGASLLSFGKKEAELETLFLKLVKGEGGNHG
jgi:hypothetical protein